MGIAKHTPKPLVIVIQKEDLVFPGGVTDEESLQVPWSQANARDSVWMCYIKNNMMVWMAFYSKEPGIVQLVK